MMLIKGFKKREKKDDLDKLRDLALKWLTIIVIAFFSILIVIKLIKILI